MVEGKNPLEALGVLAQILSEVDDGSPLPVRAELEALLDPIHPSDLAELISLAPEEAQFPLFEAIPEDEDAAEVLACVDEAARENILAQLSLRRTAELVSELSYDDAADVVGDLPAEEQDKLLAHLDAEDAAEVRVLAAHPPDSAGGIMNTEFVKVTSDQTVRSALLQIKTGDEDWEEVGEIIVVDEEGRLAGMVEFNELLRAKGSQILREIIDDEAVSILVSEDKEEAARKAAHYRVALLPVVDEAQKVVGAITFDDIMDALGEEASEDMYRLAGTLDTNPTREGLWERLLQRFPFLLVTIAGSYAVALFIQWLAPGDHDAGILAFIPMIAALAGNAGLQASTMMIRGFATGEVQLGHFRQILSREFTLGILTGGSAGLVCVLLLFTGEESRRYMVLVPVAQTLSVVVATMQGTIIPFLCLKAHFTVRGRTFRIDPALAAGPFITTLNDIISTVVALLLTRWMHP